jgi:hypothetical protein
LKKAANLKKAGLAGGFFQDFSGYLNPGLNPLNCSKESSPAPKQNSHQSTHSTSRSFGDECIWSEIMLIYMIYMIDMLIYMIYDIKIYKIENKLTSEGR